MNNGQPDRVPIFDFLYSRNLYEEVIGKRPDYYNGEDVMTCAAKLGIDIGVIPLGGVGGILNYSESKNEFQDEWGTTYKKNEAVSWPADAPVGFPISDRNDWENYEVPDPEKPGRIKEIEAALKLSKASNIAVVGVVRGPFTAAWLLTGIDRFSLLLYDDPDLIDEILKAVTDFSIAGGIRMIEAGVDIISFADDYGSINGPFISPVHFERHIIPQLGRMVKTFKDMGMPVMMHSDGHIKPLLDRIMNTGINAYHPVERAAGMDLKATKETYGSSLCLMGNVDNKTTLVTGSVEDVIAETKECIKVAGPGGGYILASDHSIKDDMPNENIIAMFETGRKYGKYPIST
jgi:uroporphyrinogen decarboxylase